MALSGSITNADGTPSTYFVLQDVHIWYNTNMVDVNIVGYYSEATYMSPCISNYNSTEQFTFAQLGITEDVTVAQIYSALQSLPKFAGSVVV